jgi:bifunctional DNA-binding transcriptional regulator/antitoxin component of YhaV-PrlF toxin-antitoxin module
MTETRYYKEKIYVPQEIRKKLRLSDGDLVRFEVAKDGEARLVVVRAGEATQRILQRVMQPPNLGHIVGTLRREDLYDDIA